MRVRDPWTAFAIPVILTVVGFVLALVIINMFGLDVGEPSGGIVLFLFPTMALIIGAMATRFD